MPQPILLPIMSLPSPVNSEAAAAKSENFWPMRLVLLTTIHSLSVLLRKKSGYTPEYVEQNEQTLKNPVLHDFFAWYTGPLEQTDLPKVDQLFQKETEVIRTLAQKESCVIVGRLANYILKDRPGAYHVFISADTATEAARVAERDHISVDELLQK